MELVERDEVLADLAGALAAAITGRGSFTFLAGEAGLGKTSVVREFVDRNRSDVLILVGACDALSTPRPLGPIRDMAETSREVAELLRVHARHDLFTGLLGLISTPGRPAVVVFEDVHWADAATLDLLRFVGRRVGTTHALVLATYRSDEIGTDHPLRGVLGDLATVPAVRRRALLPLSREGVATLAASVDGAVDADRLHERTGGNPFFVTEVLADPETDLPHNVRDAVLARRTRLPERARHLLDAVSVVPGGTERWLVHALVGPDPDDVDACVTSGMLRADDRGSLSFRHELARLAVESVVPPARKLDLHAAVVRALTDRDDPPLARVVHHADAAGDGDTVLHYARLAAEAAADRGAPQQASDHLRRALRYLDRLDTDEERAVLLERYAELSSRAARWGAGLDAIVRAVGIRRQLGEPLALANALRIQALVRYQAGQSPAAYASIEEAVGLVERLGPSPVMAEVLTESVTLAMLARRYTDATAVADRAIELASRFGRQRSLAAALVSIGSVEILTGEMEVGTERVLRGIDVARAAGVEHEVARGLGNLGSGAGEVREYAVAERYLLEDIAYASERDLDTYAHYAGAWLARVLFETGRWGQAADALVSLPQEPAAAGVITVITALTVRGRLRSRRGDPGADELLAQAWELASSTDDLQRLWPAAAARGEAALQDGHDDGVGRLIAPTFERAVDAGHPWAIGELGWLLWRAGSLGAGQHEVIERQGARPYRLHVSGRIAEAAAAWADIGCPYERAEALADGDEEQQREALELFDGLGAAPAAARLRRRMREAGVRSIPRGPRPSTANHPAGLTPRESEVLALVADGLTNAQIAEALFISEKTAGHHVSNILAKLGVSSRQEAAELRATMSGGVERGPVPT